MIRRQLRPEKKVLRVYDVTNVSWPSAHSFFDIEIGFAANWYIEVGVPNRQWIAEIGWLSQDGQFFSLVRSNVVRTPRHGLSEVVDEEWMMPDALSKWAYGISSLEAYPTSR